MILLAGGVFFLLGLWIGLGTGPGLICRIQLELWRKGPKH